MRPALLLASVAVLLAPTVTAAPTPKVQRTITDPSLVVDAHDAGTTIALSRRTSKLTRRDGTIDLDEAELHLARARAKFARGLANFEANTGERHFLAPALVDPALLPPADGPGAETIGEPAEAGAGTSPSANRARRDKIFGESGIRLHGIPDPLPVPSIESSAAKRRALRKRWIPNPKVIANPKFTGKAGGSSATKTGLVSLTNYGDGTIFYGSLKVGSQGQAFTVNIDTGSADLWLPSASCNSAACNAHTKYDPSTSSTSAQVAGKTLNIQYGDGSSTSGVVYSDNVNFGGLTATAQSLGVATSMSSGFQSDPYDGLLGMAYGSISTMGTTPLFQTLISQGKVAKSQFSTYLAASGSELYLGGMNSARYVAGSTHWYPVISQGYWTLAAKAAIAKKTVAGLGTFNALVDTGTSVIVAPTASAQQFWASVPNAAPYGTGGYWTYLCASPPDISFAFGTGFGELWTVSSQAFNLGRISTGSDRCVGAVVGADIGINAWVLGDTFLQSVYTTFDLSTNQVGFSSLA